MDEVRGAKDAMSEQAYHSYVCRTRAAGNKEIRHLRKSDNMETLVTSLSDMKRFAQEEHARLMARVLPGTSATVIGLSGDLGAGKTAFAKAFAEVLGITDSVPSPTFVLARFYAIPAHSPFARLVHIDAYRIESLTELAPLHFDELLADPHNLILIEWPERLGGLFPEDSRMLHFTVIDETTRKIRA